MLGLRPEYVCVLVQYVGLGGGEVCVKGPQGLYGTIKALFLAVDVLLGFIFDSSIRNAVLLSIFNS